MHRFSILLVLITLCSVMLSAQRNLSLEEAIRLGMDTNIQFKQNEIDKAKAESRIKELRASGLPQVSGSIGYQYYVIVPQQPVEDFISPSVFGILEGTGLLPVGTYSGDPDIFEFSFFMPHNVNVGIDANWLIFDGSYLVALEAARVFRDLTEHNLEVSKQQVKNNITKAYLNVLLTDINKLALQNNISSLEKLRFETFEIYKAGFVEHLDIDRLDLSLMNLRTELEKLHNVTNLAENLLKLQIGIPVSDTIILTEDIDMIVNKMKLEKVDMSEELNFDNLPDYKQIEYGIQMQELDVKRIERSKLPTVSAFVSGTETLSRENLFDSDQAGWLPSLGVGFGVNVPIYDAGRRNAQIELSRLNIEETELKKSQFIDAKLMEVANAKLEFQNAKSTLANAEKVLEITNSIYEKTLIKYKEGVGSSLEVNQAESEVYSAQATFINAIYSLVNANTNLDISLGK